MDEETAKYIEECRKTLLTCDGKGKEAKEVALASLEEVAFNNGYKEAYRFLKAL